MERNAGHEFIVPAECPSWDCMDSKARPAISHCYPSMKEYSKPLPFGFVNIIEEEEGRVIILN
jgi:hypothetical protein